MTRTAAKAVAWGLVSAGLALYLTGLWLRLIAASTALSGQDVLVFLILAVFGPLGGLIATRQPRNAIGWLFCAVAIFAGLGTLARGYTTYWLATGSGPRRLGETTAVYTEISWIGWVLVPTMFLLLLFPDGRLVSRRWRPVAWCAGASIVVDVVGSALSPGPVPDFPEVVNPYGVAFPAWLAVLPVVLGVVGLLGAVLSPVLRFRRVHGVQRQQIKWLAYAGAVAAPTVVVGILTYEAIGADVANVVIQGAVLSLPVAAGIAILRYRLYDIDVVINRTLVYGALTATLAAGYLGSVLLLQLLLRPLTERSDLAVAGSTLAAAALFRPARSWIQAWVDRRFYRRRYDAARTLDQFSDRLREQLDLEALGGDLREVVRQTVQPAHVSLWLRETAR